MILTLLPGEKLGAIWVPAIFQNCRNENLIWTITPVLIYIFGVYTYVFMVKESNETTRNWIIPTLQIQDGCQQNNNVYIANQILFVNIP